MKKFNPRNFYYLSFLSTLLFLSCSKDTINESVLQIKTNIEDVKSNDSDAVLQSFTVVEYEPVKVSKQIQTKILVHYMPWFETPEYSQYSLEKFDGWGLHWTMASRHPDNFISQNKRDIASYYYPMIGPYDNGEDDYLEYAVSLIKLSGIDGLIIDTPLNSEIFDHPFLNDHTLAIIPWLKKAGLDYALCYEDSTINQMYNLGVINSRVEQGKIAIKYAEDNFFKDDNYFRIDGKNVLLNFGPQAIVSDEEWFQVFSVLDNEVAFFPLAYHGREFNLEESVAGAYAWDLESVSSDFYNYAQKFKYHGGAINFEFRDFSNQGGWYSTIPDRPFSEERVKVDFQRALDYNSDFIQIITWNDWGEGTAIEPSLEYEFHQLVVIKELLGLGRDSKDLELPIDLYKKRKEYKNDAYINKKLDQVFYYLISLQTDKARDLLNSI